MEHSTSMTFLYYKGSGAGATFAKLIDITSFPDLFTAPTKLDISDLSSNQKKYAPGVIDVPDQQFGFVYTKATYDACKALDNTEATYQLRFGENGEYGAWEWTGTHFTNISGGNVGAARLGTVTCYTSSDILPVTITAGTTEGTTEPGGTTNP